MYVEHDRENVRPDAVVVVSHLDVEEVPRCDLTTSWLDVVNTVLLNPGEVCLPVIDERLLVTPVRRSLQIQVLWRLEGEPDAQAAGVGEYQVDDSWTRAGCSRAEEQLEWLQLPYKLLLVIDAYGCLEISLQLFHLTPVQLVDSIHLELSPHHGLGLQSGTLCAEVGDLDAGVLDVRPESEVDAATAGPSSLPFRGHRDLVHEFATARRVEVQLQRLRATPLNLSERAAQLERVFCNRSGFLVRSHKFRLYQVVDCQVRVVQDHDLVLHLLASLHCPQIQAFWFQRKRWTLSVTNQLQRIGRSFIRRIGCGRQQSAQRPLHEVVLVLDDMCGAVHGSREDALAGRAEVRSQGSGLGGSQLPCSTCEPESGAEARRNAALVRNGDLRNILDGAQHAGRDARARWWKGDSRLAAAEGQLWLPGPASHPNCLGLTLIVVHYNLESGDVGSLVFRHGGCKL
mmetsp:Transcript_42905/g.77533  ORF Transcript_42905/g.77533 Transcript_42905/m.77533 type:complete len:457 (+) Transcript_42905:1644-3014(+)